MPAEKLLRRSVVALACAASLAAVNPASAMMLPVPTLPQSGPHVEKVWCGWGGCGWGWGPAAVVGAVIGGAAIGAAAASSSPYYYGGYYGAPAYYPPGPYYGGSCLRRWVDYYGYAHWRRVC
jgi:hypothetical protein